MDNLFSSSNYMTTCKSELSTAVELSEKITKYVMEAFDSKRLKKMG
jgi:hypothetical protein